MNNRQRSINIPNRVQAQKTPFMYVLSVVVVRLLRFLFYEYSGQLPPPMLLSRTSYAAGALGSGLLLDSLH